MASVGLMFVGAVLFVNGLLLLGKIDAKSAGVFNIFVGVLQVAVPFYLIATAETPDDILLSAGIFLFGFTYLYVGITNLAGYPPLGLGWYCFWVMILAAAFGLTNIIRFDDVNSGMLWLHWAVLWALFGFVLALGRDRLTPVTGWVTLVMSFTTCTIPGFLLLLGEWGNVSTALVFVVTAVEVAFFLAVAASTMRRGVSDAQESPASTPGAVA